METNNWKQITIKDNKPVFIVTLKNDNGLEVKISNYGCRIISIKTPDKHGNIEDIVLGYDTIEEYFKENPHYGATIGRYANRIKNGRFSIEDNDYQVSLNHSNNHLHGGFKGFQDVVWDIEEVNNSKITFSYLSKHLEEGYPGNLNVKTNFTFNNKNELIIDYLAISDKPTIINFTHHSYFNLKGEGKGAVTDHILEINADNYIEIDQEIIPTGEIKSVENTPFDFRKATRIGERINDDFQQLNLGNGYDHSFVLDHKENKSFDARVTENSTGRVLEVLTTQPGLHLYTSNFLSKSEKGKGGKIYDKWSAFCIETQHYANSPNISHFPSTVLLPEAEYKHQTIYRFLVSSE